jgi:hypothetical protein
MKDELIRKIQDVLGRRITNEKQVVYLLVELRKLMDRDNYKNPVLRTFSNWVVHTSLEVQREGSTFILTELTSGLLSFTNTRGSRLTVGTSHWPFSMTHSLNALSTSA